MYDNSVEQEVILFKSNYRAGTGDCEDDMDIREDQFGEFYGIYIGRHFENMANMGGCYLSIEEAKIYAQSVCPSLEWGTSGLDT